MEINSKLLEIQTASDYFKKKSDYLKIQANKLYIAGLTSLSEKFIHRSIISEMAHKRMLSLYAKTK